MCVQCGVCVLCVVVSGVLCVCSCVLVCGLWCLCVMCVVCGAAWHAENLPCVGSKRLRVLVQNTSVCTGETPRMSNACARFPVHMEAFRTYTRGRFEPTHVEPLTRLSFSLSLVLSSFSLPSFSVSAHLSSLCSLLSSLSNNHNDHSFSRLSLCTKL